MPKDRRNHRAPSSERSAHAPYPCSSSGPQKNPPCSVPHPPEQPATAAEARVWDETRCPVCMDHPHNAVLLLCSSHEQGCRAYLCDTSYRHSNCLDQFRRASSSYAACQDGTTKGDREEGLDLSCPLCRGAVKDWVVVEAARRYMNAKTRACSLESCNYSGAYGELRRHARMEHPAVRPADADPERQRDWRRMEWQRDIGDLLTTINPLFAGDRETVVAGNVEEVARPAAAYPSPRLLISLSVRVPGAEGGGQARPRVIISFAPRDDEGFSDDGGYRRRRTHSHWGEIFDGADDASGGGGGDTGHEDDATEAQSADRSGQSRHRRRMQ